MGLQSPGHLCPICLPRARLSAMTTLAAAIADLRARSGIPKSAGMRPQTRSREENRAPALQGICLSNSAELETPAPQACQHRPDAGPGRPFAADRRHAAGPPRRPIASYHHRCRHCLRHHCSDATSSVTRRASLDGASEHAAAARVRCVRARPPLAAASVTTRVCRRPGASAAAAAAAAPARRACCRPAFGSRGALPPLALRRRASSAPLASRLRDRSLSAGVAPGPQIALRGPSRLQRFRGWTFQCSLYRGHPGAGHGCIQCTKRSWARGRD